MKKAVLILTLLLSGAAAQAKTELPELLGRWSFFGMIYRGQYMAPLNARLELKFEFNEIGISNLFYSRDGEPGFCERRAIFDYQSSTGLLHQTVVWTNPLNRPDCGHDPDMQTGRESWTPVNIINGVLSMKLSLGDDDLTYLWRRCDGRGGVCGPEAR